MRLGRPERVAVGSDTGGDAGTPDFCSCSVICRRVLAMMSEAESGEGYSSGNGDIRRSR